MLTGIIAAMPEEVQLIRERMQLQRLDVHGGREYAFGTLHNEPVVVVFSRWGKVAASITTTTLIHHYNVDQIIITGVAGGMSDSLKIGDIVIASQYYQHDMDARPLFNRHQIPLTDSVFFNSNPSLQQRAYDAAVDFSNNITSLIDRSKLEKFNFDRPKVHVGIIGTGDVFLACPDFKKSVKTAMSKIIAADMESAAIAQVCEDYKIPYTAIRIISDNAGTNAHKDFFEFVTQCAYYYTYEIISRMILNSNAVESSLVKLKEKAYNLSE